MDKVGRNLPAQLRETGLGGLAGTPTGEAIKQKSLVMQKTQSIVFIIFKILNHSWMITYSRVVLCL